MRPQTLLPCGGRHAALRPQEWLREHPRQRQMLALREFGEASATQVADFLGVSRITARRYLEHLTDTNVAERSLRYGQVGRPETRYGLKRLG